MQKESYRKGPKFTKLRKIFRAVLALSLFVLSLPVMGAGSTPKIACKAHVYDFGTMDSSESTEHTFVVSNEGTADLEIGRIRGCCGATAECATNRVAPGTNTTVKIKFTLAGRQGVQKKAFYVASNDPNQPYYQLMMAGTVTVMVSVQPSTVDFGRVQKDAVVEQEVRFCSQAKDVVSVTNLIVEGKCFSASKETTADGARIKVKTVPPLSQGVSHGKVLIFTDNAKYGSLEVPLIATVSRDIVVVPEELSLVAGDGNKVEPVTRYIALRSRNGKKFNIKVASLPEKDMKVDISSVGDNGYKIIISNIMPFEDLEGKNIVLTTDHREAMEIIIPIHVSIGNAKK